MVYHKPCTIFNWKPQIKKREEKSEREKLSFFLITNIGICILFIEYDNIFHGIFLFTLTNRQWHMVGHFPINSTWNIELIWVFMLQSDALFQTKTNLKRHLLSERIWTHFWFPTVRKWEKKPIFFIFPIEIMARMNDLVFVSILDMRVVRFSQNSAHMPNYTLSLVRLKMDSIGIDGKNEHVAHFIPSR